MMRIIPSVRMSRQGDPKERLACRAPVLHDLEQAFTPAASEDVRAQGTVDLDSMAFAEGGHLMTNKRCDLHSKSWR